MERKMAIEDWVKDDAGDIILNPLVDYEIRIALGMGILVRLSVADRSLEPGTALGSVQLALVPVQARELARSLVEAADRSERPPPPGTPRQ
jgi:hypothetical protein